MRGEPRAGCVKFELLRPVRGEVVCSSLPGGNLCSIGKGGAKGGREAAGLSGTEWDGPRVARLFCTVVTNQARHMHPFLPISTCALVAFTPLFIR